MKEFILKAATKAPGSKSTLQVVPEETEFLSRHQVASLFGVSVSTVTRWARTGALRAMRTPGGHYRFRAEETLRAARLAAPDEPRRD